MSVDILRKVYQNISLLVKPTDNFIIFSFSANFLEEWCRRFRPDRVTRLKGMEIVVHHHALRERTVRIEEPSVEITPNDFVAVGEPLDEDIDLFLRDSPRMVGRGAAGEYRQQNRLRLRLLSGDDVEDGLDAGRRVVRTFPAVVRADHQHETLGAVAVQLAVLKTPQDVLRTVAAEAEVEHGISFLLLHGL